MAAIPATNKAGIMHTISDFTEDYFHPLGREVVDLTNPVFKDTISIPKGESTEEVIAELDKKNHQNSYSLKKVILTTLKIASYLTVIIPLIMYVARLILRKTHTPLDKPLPSIKLSTTTISSKPEIKKPESPSRDQKIAIFGDVHGELDGFKENLLRAKVIDEKGNFNKSFKGIVIQMGDVIDRGPKSIESWSFLQNLQTEKPEQVIRLLGNHELMLLEKDYRFANFPEPEKLAEEIKQEILAGKVQASYCDGSRLYTHAGIHPVIKQQLILEIQEKQHLTTVSNKDISDYMNELLIQAVRDNNFEHPIFNVSYKRGGDKAIGGIFWIDDSELLQSARDIPQVIAHNPPLGKRTAPIDITDSHRLINVDAGLCALYGGNRAFVVIGKKSQLKIHEQISGIWEKTVLADIALGS